MKLCHVHVRSRNVNATVSSQTQPESEFEEVYRKHYRRVLALCRYLLRSFDEAEDATQEVFIRVDRKRSSYDPSKPYVNWLLKIATNHCLDRLRRRGTEGRLFETSDLCPVDPSKVSKDALAGLLRAEKGERVRLAIRSLPDKYRIPLVLAYFNEFSYDEIGSSLKLKRNTVATLIYRARQRLRERLNER